MLTQFMCAAVVDRSSQCPHGFVTMSGSLLAMPMLVINMGGEMVYILEQRLRAQNIPGDKSRKGGLRWLCDARTAPALTRGGCPCSISPPQC